LDVTVEEQKLMAVLITTSMKCLLNVFTPNQAVDWEGLPIKAIDPYIRLEAHRNGN
jgi:hypothetical protein